MVIPKPLHAGQTVAIVSTARAIDKITLAPAIALLQSWGLLVELGATIGPVHHQFAGNDQLRTKDLQMQLDNPNIAAIWCARGGYGTVRILDQLNLKRFKSNPKWLIGYSDVTALHSLFFTQGIASLHATMPIDFAGLPTSLGNTQEAQDSLKRILFGGSVNYQISSNFANRTGIAKGRLIGGNLSVLYSLCGSSASVNTWGAILFLEDLDEYLYHIDRMMQNLKRNGMLANLAGLVVGGFTKMHDNTIPFGATVSEIILQAVAEYNYPVCFDFPSGHLHDNRPLIMGQDVELHVTPQTVTLNYELSQ